MSGPIHLDRAVAEALARLRPGASTDDLARALGRYWDERGPTEEGHVFVPIELGFGAQIDVGGFLGCLDLSASTKGGFPSVVPVEGLRIGMTIEEAHAARPDLALLTDSDPERPGIAEFHAPLPPTDVLRAYFREGRLVRVRLERPGATYPTKRERHRARRGPNPPRRAYDLRVTPRPITRGEPGGAGWCFGLPPGLPTRQWPLSRRYGYPMRHVFTVAVPEDYRAHGPDLVALTLFVDDEDEGLASLDEVAPEVAAILADAAEQPPPDLALRPFWEHARARHPRRHDFEDLIGRPYAAMWLTAEEFAAPWTQPPEDVVGHPVLAELGDVPEWLAIGGAGAFCEAWGHRGGGPGDVRGPSQHGLVVEATIREGDPNVGRVPCETWDYDPDDPDAYIPPWSERGEALGLRRFHGSNHFGGAMIPVQAVPRFGPRYLEFEQEFGGLNFGGDGNGQIDLVTMRLNWGCG